MGRRPKNSSAKTSVSPEDILISYLKEKEEEHYNFEPEINYKVSTGSLLLDIETGGGLGPGLHRFCGINEGIRIINSKNSGKIFSKMESRTTHRATKIQSH